MTNKEYNIKKQQMGGGELKEDLGGGSSELAPATADTLGGVKIGNGISVTEDGTISAQGGGKNAKPLVRVNGVSKFVGNFDDAQNITRMTRYKFLMADKNGVEIDVDHFDPVNDLIPIENFDKESILNGDFDIIFNAPLAPNVKLHISTIVDMPEQGMAQARAYQFQASEVETDSDILYGPVYLNFVITIVYDGAKAGITGLFPTAFIDNTSSNMSSMTTTYTKENIQ